MRWDEFWKVEEVWLWWWCVLLIVDCWCIDAKSEVSEVEVVYQSEINQFWPYPLALALPSALPLASPYPQPYPFTLISLPYPLSIFNPNYPLLRPILTVRFDLSKFYPQFNSNFCVLGEWRIGILGGIGFAACIVFGRSRGAMGDIWVLICLFWQGGRTVLIVY